MKPVDPHQTLKMLQAILDDIPIALFAKSGRPQTFGEFILLNKAQADLLQRPTKELIGKTDFDLFPLEQATFFHEVDQAAFREGHMQEVSEEPIDTPGGRRWLHTRKVPMYDLEGNPDFLIGVSEDITVRREYQEALEGSQLGLRAVVYAAEQFVSANSWKDVLPEVMRTLGEAASLGRCWLASVQSDAGLVILDFLCMWERRFDKTRWRPPTLQGVNIENLGFDMHLDDFRHGNLVSGRTGDLPPHQQRFLRIQKAETYVAAPVLVGGRLWGIFVVDQPDETREWSARDMEVIRAFNSILASTIEREVSAEELRMAEDKLRHAQRMETLGQLAGGIAHDFNNMLTSILGYTRLAMDQITDGSQLTEDLQEVLDVGEQAAQLARQMLVLSRKHEVEVRAIDVNEAVREFDHMFRRALEAHIELITILRDDESPILANQEQIELVFMNLAINARDAMPQGGKLWFEVSNVELERGSEFLSGRFRPGHFVQVMVRDTGEGMPPDVIDKVFEPFFTTKELGKGTGLGLSTAAQIVRQYGGIIHLESEIGKGTTFRIFFPRISSKVVPRLRESDIDSAAVAGSERVLVVEDETTLRSLARRILGKLGYEVLIASSGSEALQLLIGENVEVDLILSDVMMPHMSGPELIRRLREHGRTIPVLFMSGYMGDMIDSDGLLQGEHQILAKPFTRAELARRVRQHLDRVPT